MGGLGGIIGYFLADNEVDPAADLNVQLPGKGSLG